MEQVRPTEEQVIEGKFSRAAAGALVGLGMLTNPATAKEPVTPARQEAPVESGGYPINILARTLWAEGRGEKDPRALEAIATVIWNRAVKKYGEDQVRKNPMLLVRVVLAPKQFSCWNKWTASHPHDLPPMKERDGLGWDASKQVARILVDGSFTPVEDIGHATHYYNPNLTIPSWRKHMAGPVRIGQHLFGRVNV